MNANKNIKINVNKTAQIRRTDSEGTVKDKEIVLAPLCCAI